MEEVKGYGNQWTHVKHDKQNHNDVIKCQHFPRYWTFVRGIHRSPMSSPHKGQWRGALMFSLICTWINSWVNTREAGDLRRHRAHYDGTIMRTRDQIVLVQKQFGDKHLYANTYLIYALFLRLFGHWILFNKFLYPGRWPCIMIRNNATTYHSLPQYVVFHVILKWNIIIIFASKPKVNARQNRPAGGSRAEVTKMPGPHRKSRDTTVISCFVWRVISTL